MNGFVQVSCRNFEKRRAKNGDVMKIVAAVGGAGILRLVGQDGLMLIGFTDMQNDPSFPGYCTRHSRHSISYVPRAVLVRGGPQNPPGRPAELPWSPQRRRRL